jgi:hypothetical protein
MKRIEEVANYIHMVGNLRSGLSVQHAWHPADTRACDDAEIRRRARFLVLDGIVDVAMRANDSFAALEKWCLANHVVSAADVADSAFRHGRTP